MAPRRDASRGGSRDVGARGAERARERSASGRSARGDAKAEPRGEPRRDREPQRERPARSASAGTASPARARAGGATREREQARVAQYPEAPLPPQHQEPPGIEAKLDPRPMFEAPVYRPAGKLEGRVALVTGGDSGIGRAVALIYAREGADVAIVFLEVEREDADETRRQVERTGRRCLLLPGDVTSAAFCRDAVERTVRELGGLDILVNNAAVQQNVGSLEELTEAQWERTFRTNIFGYFYMAKAALPHLKPGAAIVNTGSITGLEGSKDLLDYSATKGAIHAFTKSLAQNLVERKIRVNCVAPGPVWTPLNPQAKPAAKVKDFGADQPMKRPAQPEEIAPAYVFFASGADSSYITGEVLTLLGGETTAG
jgi:NAD(P)-dependent dehydrogenase (short-subunit alcohol dehydrogenase family)